MTFSNIIGCTGSLIFILFASTRLPFIGPLFSLLTPLPFLFYSSKLGRNEGIKVCAVAILIVGIASKLDKHPELLLFCLEFGIVGLILGELFRKELSYSATVFWGTVFALITGLVFFGLFIATRDISPVEIAGKYFQEIWAGMISAYENQGIDPQRIDMLKQAGPKIAAILKKIYPSLTVVWTGLVIWFNVIISKPLFLAKGVKYPDMGRPDRWSAPDQLVWGVIIALLIEVSSISAFNFAAQNALVIFAAIYAFHGLSVVLFFFNKYNVPSLARYILYLMIVFHWVFMIIIAVTGFLDQWIDFRKINSRSQVDE